MKLIRTRAPAASNGPPQPNEKKQRLKSPTTVTNMTATGPSIDHQRSGNVRANKLGQARQANLNLSSNQFLKAPNSASLGP